MGVRTGVCRGLVGKHKRKRQLGKISVNGFLILKEVLWKYFGRRGLH
jgi:hypothetical protein